MKTKEQELKSASQRAKDKMGSLRDEVAELQREKSGLTEYKMKETSCEGKRDTASKWKVEGNAVWQDMGGVAVHSESYEQERKLCSTLIAYLRRLDGGDAGMKDTPASVPLDSAVDEHLREAVNSRNPVDSGMLLVRPKDEELILFAGTGGNKEKRRKDKKNRLVNHTPDLLDYFARLKIRPPSSVSSVRETIEKIQSLQDFFESQSSKKSNKYKAAESHDADVDVDVGSKDGSSWEWVEKEDGGA